jgi:hypothetical protein
MLLNYFKRFYFPVFVVIALLMYMMQHLSIPLPTLINNHLNDLLCMPIVLKICQYVVRHIRNDTAVQIPIRIALTLTLFYALYFELILPKFNERYTADMIDVGLYSIGFVFFIGIERFGTSKATH